MEVFVACKDKSENVKTGPIPTTVSSSNTCPDACPMKGSTCYAELGPLKLHWLKVSEKTRGGTYDDFIKWVDKLPTGVLWRHNVAGDLAGNNNEINADAINKLVEANIGKKGFTYTHKPVTPVKGAGVDVIFRNKNIIKSANDNGFTINISADDILEADAMVALNIGPVVTVLPSDVVEDFKTPAGNVVKICPAVIDDNYTCANCGICQKVKRRFIVGFPAHGSRKNKLNKSYRDNLVEGLSKPWNLDEYTMTRFMRIKYRYSKIKRMLGIQSNREILEALAADEFETLNKILKQ